MIETTIETSPGPGPPARPPIPAILHLRRKYGKHYGCHRRQIMALRKPTMGDRMDKAAEAAFRRQQDELAKEEEKAQRRYEEQVRREQKRAAQDRAKYKGRHQL